MRALLATLLVLTTLLAACGESGEMSTEASSTSAPVAEVTSEILAQHETPEAPGFTMYLYRVEIPAGFAIDAHQHPGQQMARIEAGTLTYTVLDGEVEIGRDSSTPTETVEATVTVDIEAGDSIFEPAGMVHEARNDGDGPVVILASSLFPTGAELSTLD